MNDPLVEIQARHQFPERVARASEPKIAAAPRRHLLAQKLRRFADRIDS